MGDVVPEPMPILLATTSAGKRREYEELLNGLPLRLVSLADVGIRAVVEESGTTFAQNAALKARAYSAMSGMVTIAEDSGLEVAALGGAPGVFSARWEGLPDGPLKNARLLDRLRDVPWEQRRCRYVAVVAIVDPDGHIWQTRGECRGYVALTPTGDGGFGFDPIFFVPRYGRTMAELPAAVKNRISHRARAVNRARAILARLIVPAAPSSVPPVSARD